MKVFETDIAREVTILTYIYIVYLIMTSMMGMYYMFDDIVFVQKYNNLAYSHSTHKLTHTYVCMDKHTVILSEQLVL